MAEIQKDKAEKSQIEGDRAKEETERRKRMEDARREAEEDQQKQLAAFRAEVPKLFAQIETWIRDEPAISFDRDDNKAIATLMVEGVQIIFEPGSGSSTSVQAGADISGLPWSKVRSGVVNLDSKSGDWYVRRETSLVPLDQSQFNHLIESWLQAYHYDKLGRP